MRLFDAGDRGSREVHDRVLTVANAITALRLLGIPLFVWLLLAREAPGAAFATLSLIAATDWLDGYVARRFDQVTRLGQLLDPLVDRLLLATAVLSLLAAGILPWPVAALIIARDAGVLAGAAALFRGAPPIAVSRLGKTATALLMVGIPAFLLGRVEWAGAAAVRPVAWLVTIAGLLAYYAAAASYLAEARAALRARGGRGEAEPPAAQRTGTGSPRSR